MKNRKRLAFGAVFGVILLGVTLVGVEVLSSFYTPAWPARAMNPREPAPVRILGEGFKNQPWLADGDNSWGMRDVERTVAKPAGAYRALFVGDSFVESRFTPLALPAAVEKRLPELDGRRIEAVNLGVGATDPRSYYYRIRDVGLEIQPDAVLLFLYAGNDFMAPGAGYSIVPKWIDESAGGSVVGSIMPRTNWLLVNRLDLSAFFRSRSTAPPNDEETLFSAVTAPADQRLKRIVKYVKTHHYPNESEEKLTEILARGDNRFFDIAAPTDKGEQEYLLDWMFGTLLSWEARDFEVAANREDVARVMGFGQVDSTFSWIEATQKLLSKRGVPLVVFQVPMGSVDPDYVEFWKPWPRAYSWNYICDEWQTRLGAKMVKAGIRTVDLRDVLNDVPGTYRKLDGHWSQKGEAIVAERVDRELKALITSSTVQASK